jgi:ATP-dependent protease HslVU (ClpYQ) peptidase subunit
LRRSPQLQGEENNLTTLAAIQGDGWAVIGYDSRVTEDNRIFVLPKESGKVVKNGQYIFGAAGDMRAVNLLAHTFKPPAPSATDYGVKLDKFISSKFVPALKSCFDEAQYGEKGEQDSTVLVVVHGTIYEIGSGYDWCHDDSGVYAMGSGAQYALGAMLASLEGKKRTMPAARSIVKAAVSISARLDPSTGEPVHVLAQKWDTSQ